MNEIDLNCDLGEGCGNDTALLAMVSSANIACGAHAGDPVLMAATVAMAKQHDVVIGAHLSYPDREGFGRRPMTLPAGQLRAHLLYQLGALAAIAAAAGTRVAYVKPHGALYNRITVDADVALTVVETIRAFDPALPLLTLPDCAAAQIARQREHPVIAEGFADRAYQPDGKLQSRSEPGAVLDEPAQVAARAVRMVREGKVCSTQGSQVEVPVRSLCVHGDTPAAVEMTAAICSAFEQAGITIRAFA